MKLKFLESEKENEQKGGGMDIFNRIRRLIRGQTDETNSLKRRSEEQLENSHFAKYRRVTNDFPKYISKPFEDDMQFIRPAPKLSASLMSQKRKSYEKPNSHLRSNNNYADLEYSDDEDDIVPQGIPIASSSFNSHGLNVDAVRQTPVKHNNEYLFKNSRVVNIPVRVEPTKGKPQVPPLIETRTGNIISGPPMPALNPIHKTSSFFTGLMNTMGVGRRNSGLINSNLNHRSSLNYMNGDLDHTIPIFNKQNAKNIHHTSYMMNSPNNVVNKVYNVQEKEQYADLLKQLVPGLYDNKCGIGGGLSGFRTTQNIGGRRAIHENLNQELVDRIDLTTKNKSKGSGLVINLEDDFADQKDTIDLDAEESHIISQYRKLNEGEISRATNLKEVKKDDLPYVDPINTLREKNELAPLYQPTWLTQFKEKFAEKQRLRNKQISEAKIQDRKHSEETEQAHRLINEKLQNFRIAAETIVLDEEEEEEVEFPEFSDEDDTLIKKSIYRGPETEVLINKFNMSITRRDISTLTGDTWLNDEVINFYMNLLIERGETRNSEGYPKVYAMNTFFIPRLMSGGHSAVRRWTRKIDIFKYDIIPVPVHVGNVHWCMAIIHLKNKTIKYYDSMGTANSRVLLALEQYLKDEAMDKKGLTFDTSNFSKESVPDCPRQMNGSDCGVFSCMFAEYVTRSKDITFSQQHMQYFRHKMILEIVKGKLLL